MNKRLVSCIIPSYRGEKYLPDAIESVLSQDFPNKEIIVVIEFFLGDNSYSLYEKRYAHIPFVKFHVFYEKMTPAKARNLWIKLASGEYICVLDDDDFFVWNSHLTRGVTFLETHADYWFVSFSSKILFGDQLLRYRWTDTHHSLDKFNFTHSGTIFRNNLLTSVNFYNPLFRFYEDLDLFLRLGDITKNFVLPELVVKRFNITSITNRYSAFHEFYFWLKVVSPFRWRYSWFYFGFLKKIVKCFLPRRLQKIFFKIQVKINWYLINK